MTKKQYKDFVEKCRTAKFKKYPAFDALNTGGVVGSIEIADCVKKSKSPWFFGPYGFILKNARKLPFRPMKGKLNIWEV